MSAVDDPSFLLDLSDDRFRRIVETDVQADRRTVTAASAALRSPEVIERFHTQLLILQRSVEGRLATRAAFFEKTRHDMLGDKPGTPTPQYLQARADYFEARGKALRFKTALDQRVVEVGLLRSRLADDRAHLAARVRELEDGILRWWATVDGEADDAAAEAADVALRELVGPTVSRSS